MNVEIKIIYFKGVVYKCVVEMLLKKHHHQHCGWLVLFFQTISTSFWINQVPMSILWCSQNDDHSQENL